MDKFLRDVASTLTIVVRNSAGVEVAATSPPTVVVKDGAGTTVLPSTVSTLRAGTTGTYDVTLVPSVVNKLDTFEATWTVVLSGNSNTHRTSFETVGGFMFTISELRAHDSDINADQTKYTAAKIVEARQKAEDRIEDLCGVAFRPRGRRTRLHGSGKRALIVPDPRVIKVVSVDVEAGAGVFTAYAAGEIAELVPDDAGIVYRPFGQTWAPGRRNVKILYEHGYTEVPDPVKHAALALARYYLVESPIDSRIITRGDGQGGFERVSVPGRDGPTGIPEVDSVITDWTWPEQI